MTDLARTAGVGRGTVHRLFDTPSDVVTYRCELIVRDALALSASSDGTTTSVSAVILGGWIENRALLLALADAGRLDLLSAAHAAHAGEVRRMLRLPESREADARLLADPISALIPVVIADWARRGAQEDAAALSTRVRRVLRLAAA